MAGFEPACYGNCPNALTTKPYVFIMLCRKSYVLVTPTLLFSQNIAIFLIILLFNIILLLIVPISSNIYIQLN